ncbi:MAG: flagellin [Deltaproteobacteria bacterium HGW-Deltaproteobacteria-24]|nr:MAG: flagellin [Deltaproteobacteria bacterium HGW-Deltaproteobacteria-24]
MDIGRVEVIDQSKVNHIEKMQKVQETDKKDKVDPNEQYKNAKPNEIIKDANEVILDNVKFGYNKNSQDFFVKVTQGDAEYKYPTEDMMKMKAQLLQMMEQQENK